MISGDPSVTYKKPPITEMAMVVQMPQAGVFPPLKALELYEAVKAQLPRIELHQRLQQLGFVDPVPQLIVEDEIHPRWWFLSAENDFLLQAQDNTLAFNWRKREELGAGNYPGYDVIRDKFQDYLQKWLSMAAFSQSREVSTINLLYDNVWKVDKNLKMAEIFSFWKTVGISGMQAGPNIGWSIGLEEPLLGATARIDITASRGVVVSAGEAGPGSRLQFNALGFGMPLKDVPAAFETLHAYIHGLLEKLVTPEMRASW